MTNGSKLERGERETEVLIEKEVQAFIEEAERFHEEALKEFKRATSEKNVVLLRDACEKAWNAIIQATNVLLLKKNVPLAKSHWERRLGLEELERVDSKVKELGLLDRFSARDHHLHEQGFYEGILPLSTIEMELQKVKLYIEDIKAL